MVSRLPEGRTVHLKVELSSRENGLGVNPAIIAEVEFDPSVHGVSMMLQEIHSQVLAEYRDAIDHIGIQPRINVLV